MYFSLINQAPRLIITLVFSLFISGCAGYGYGIQGGSNMGGGEASFGMAL